MMPSSYMPRHVELQGSGLNKEPWHQVISQPALPGRNLASAPEWQPMPCNSVSANPLCSSYLYVTPEGRNLSEVASDFSGNASLVQRIMQLSGSEDLLVNVPCVCEAINATMTGLFHDSNYRVKDHDTGDIINSKTFSGLALNVGDDLTIEEKLIIHLPCGCSSTAPEGVLSYAVQDGDTLGNIASVFRSSWEDILDLNPRVTNPDFIKPGWILFIPMGVAGPSNKSSRVTDHNSSIHISCHVASMCVNHHTSPEKEIYSAQC